MVTSCRLSACSYSAAVLLTYFYALTCRSETSNFQVHRALVPVDLNIVK